MVTSLLWLLVGVIAALPPSFVAPKGWVAKAPPSGASVDFIWLSPQFGINGNGENLTVTSHALPSGSTLNDVVHQSIVEMTAQRTIVNSHAESTCHGAQAGWNFDARLTLGSTIVSQIYHLTVLGGRAYAFVLTHRAGDRVAPAIATAIQSICPAKTAS